MAGLIVDSVVAGGVAFNSGIRDHDVIYKYNEVVLNTVEELVSATRSSAENNQILVIRGREILKISVPSGSLGLGLLPYPQPDIVINGVGEAINQIDRQDSEERAAKLNSRLKNMILTTAGTIETHRVVKTIEIVTSEYVSGINILKDLLSDVTDIIGGKSESIQNELKRARVDCLNQLKIEADNLGANAVIGVDLDYSEFTGGGKNMLFIVASGTAVLVEKK